MISLQERDGLKITGGDCDKEKFTHVGKSVVPGELKTFLGNSKRGTLTNSYCIILVGILRGRTYQWFDNRLEVVKYCPQYMRKNTLWSKHHMAGILM